MKKRNLLIIEIIAWGIMVPLLLVIFFVPEILDFDFSSIMTTEQKNDSRLITLCLKSFCWVSILVTKAVAKVIHSGVFQFIVFITTHVITYFILGFVIAKLIYPKKEISNPQKISHS